MTRAFSNASEAVKQAIGAGGTAPSRSKSGRREAGLGGSGATPTATNEFFHSFSVALFMACVLASWLILAGCGGRLPVSSSQPETLVANARFAAVDVETTGLDPSVDRIIEVGVVTFCDGRVVARKSWLVNPELPIDPAATAVHGISDAMVAGCPRFADIAGRLRVELGGSVLLMHNARFDTAFLSRELAIAGEPGLKNKVVDTLRLFRRWFPGRRSYSLGALGALAGRNTASPHRAADDAELMRAVFEKGLEAQRETLTVRDIIMESGSAGMSIVGADQSQN